MRTPQWYARRHPAAETPRPSPFAQRRRIMAPVPRDAFISHASVDAGLALAICEGLEKRGLTCWIAPRDVRSEGTYGTEIIRGLRECTAFLIVLTGASSESQQVEREAERASHYQKRIIPLSVGGGEPGERLEFYTAGRQRVACSTTIDDPMLDHLAAVVRGDQTPVAEAQPASPHSRPFPRAIYAGLGVVAAIAALAAWLSGALTRPSGPPANQPQNTLISVPPVQPPAQPSKQPETVATGDSQVPPVVKGPEQKARGAIASPPASEKSKSVENVSWQEATRFVARLSERRDGFTYRLPQEAEWEYAARANGRFPEQLSSVAWFGLLATAGSDARPSDVAKKRPNAWGLYDMLGNVAEWCEDWFSPGYQRVHRGGAWTDGATSLRFSARGKAVPTTRTYSIGVRVVRTPAGS